MELEMKKNDLKSLEEAVEEIELFDEDDEIPFLVGEVFLSHKLGRTQASFKIFYHIFRYLLMLSNITGTASRSQRTNIKGYSQH